MTLKQEIRIALRHWGMWARQGLVKKSVCCSLESNYADDPSRYGFPCDAEERLSKIRVNHKIAEKVEKIVCTDLTGSERKCLIAREVYAPSDTTTDYVVASCK
jgi:hypothetical protein